VEWNGIGRVSHSERRRPALAMAYALAWSLTPPTTLGLGT
jgi:hypothetical protein